MDAKISLIIPVYNIAPYLRECLDSVLAQTYTDWEAICVDDGSSDGSGKILEEYAAQDGRIHVIHQDNAGVSAARNRGLVEATGEWIWFVDGDDLISPRAMEWVAAAFQTHSDSMSVAIRYTTNREDLVSKEDAGCSGLTRYDGYGDDSLSLFFCGACGQVLRRSAIIGLIFPPYKRNEDGLFMLQAYWRGEVHLLLAEKVYYYRERPGSATGIVPRKSDVVATFETQRKMIEIMSQEQVRHPGISFKKGWEHLHWFCFYTYSGMFFKLPVEDRAKLLDEWLQLQEVFKGRYPMRMEWWLRTWLVRVTRSARFAPFIVLWRPRWIGNVRKWLKG